MSLSPEDILDDFAFLDDWKDRFRYLIDIGQEMPPMDEADKTDENRLYGCQSRVWIKPEMSRGDPPVLRFSGDSDSQLVKGLIAIVFATCNERTPQEILDFDLKAFFAKLNLENHLSPTRANGLNEMVKFIRATARAYQEIPG